jgi:hypothetical protein
VMPELLARVDVARDIDGDVIRNLDSGPVESLGENQGRTFRMVFPRLNPGGGILGRCSMGTGVAAGLTGGGEQENAL